MRKYLYIGLGGFLGAMLRAVIKDLDIYKFNGLFPLDTLLINLSGGFLIALFLTICIEVLEIDPDFRQGAATGFLGAFTTFSTVCKEVVIMFSKGHWLLAAAYSLASVFLGLAAVYLGIITAHEVILKMLNRYKADEE